MGIMAIHDDVSNPDAEAWIMNPGAIVERGVCGLDAPVFHFTGE